MIRPLNEYVSIRLLKRPERESPIVRLERQEGLSAGVVLSVGRRAHDVRVGDLVVFPRAHLVIHKAGKQLQQTLKDLEEEEQFLLKWFDILFVINEPGAVEVDGVRWTP